MCGCNKKIKHFKYTSADGKTSRTYASQAEAQQQVKTNGGSWKKV
jgi:hypothetical protein